MSEGLQPAFQEDPLFKPNDRVAFLNGLGYDPMWYFGRITEVAARPNNYVYRVSWDDGYVDKPGSAEEWYTEGELRPATEAESAPGATKRRYRVVFTPVGWQVIDTQEARDPIAEFGAGDEEYARARDKAKELNDDDS